MIQTLIADDHDLIRRSVRMLLEQDSEIKIVYEATDGQEALDKIGEIKPDIAILDISMPNLDGISASEKVLEMGLDTQIIILSMHSDPVLIDQLLKSGIRGYLIKDSLTEDLLPAVRSAVQRKIFMSPSINLPGPLFP